MRGADVGIIPAAERLNFGIHRQSGERVEVVHHGEIRLVIGEQQDGEPDARLVERELRFLLIALAVVELKPRLHGIGVGHFAAFFLLLGDVQERLGVGDAQVGIVNLTRGDGHGVVVLHDGGDEAASGDVGPGAGGGLGGHGAVVVGAFDGGEEVGVDSGLVVIDVDAVVGDESAAGCAVGLSVDVLADAVDGGQQGGFGLHGIFARQQGGDVGGEGLLAIFLRALHGVLEGEAQGRGVIGRRLGVGVLAEREGNARNRQDLRHR